MKKTQFTKCLLVLLLAGQMCTLGCHRGYYRRQADNEAQQLVAEKNTDPRWNYADGRIDIDPQSRMFDPFSADHPPIPPDDPASHQMMYRVDGKDGYPHWHANGDTDYVENPEWRSYLPVNKDGKVVIDLETAFELAKLHSTDFQQQRENLYLSALDVSLERFGFDSQLFSGFNSFFSTQGRLRGAGSATSVTNSLGSNGQGMNLQRLGTTGANFAVGLANTIMWNFAGPNTQSASTLIDFSLIQPLLRNAGRDRIMESLTLAERTLLADVRQMDRFRRGFYLEIIMGRNAGAGPGSNFLASPGFANGNAGGYLGLLQQQQNIRIQEFNVRQLENSLDQLREFYNTDRLDALLLFQFENSFYGAQNSLLQSKVAYKNNVDNFKRLLGLPPALEVIIDDPMLSKFEFISNAINQRQIEIYRVKTLTGEAVIQLANEIRENQNQVPDGKSPKFEKIVKLVNDAVQLVQKVVDEDSVEIKSDIEKLQRVRPKRIAYFDKLKQNLNKYELLSEIDPSLFSGDSITDPNELNASLTKSMTSLSTVQEVLKTIKSKLESVDEKRKNMEPAKFAADIDEILKQIPESFTVLNNIVVEFALLQAQARSDSIELEDVELSDQQAFAIARCFRRDWMNARAALVDQYRQIEFVADQLESQVDLVLEGDVGNFGDNPFRIRWENGSLRAGLRFDAPIVRLAERNSYRQTLIQYQQTKRSFYEFRDDVHLNLRRTLRDLNLNKAVFEVNRKSVQARIKQVDSTQLRLIQPPAPGQSSRLGATTARDLTDAINGLQTIQVQFLNSWVAYEVARRNLDFDLGTMQIDDQGRWIDPGKIDSSIAQRAAAMLGVPMECQFCDENAIFSEPVVDPVDNLNFESAPEQRKTPSSPVRLDNNRDEDFKLDLPKRPVPADLNPKPNLNSQPKLREQTPAPKPKTILEEPSVNSNVRPSRSQVQDRTQHPSDSRPTSSTVRPRVLKSAQPTSQNGDSQPIPATPSTLAEEEIPRLDPEPTPVPTQELAGSNEVEDMTESSNDLTRLDSKESRTETSPDEEVLIEESPVEESPQALPTRPVNDFSAGSRINRDRNRRSEKGKNPEESKQRAIRKDKSIPIPKEVLELGKQDDATKKVSSVTTPNFSKTEAPTFQKVDISELDPSAPVQGGILRPVFKSMTVLETRGKIQISALPGSHPVQETTQVGVRPEVADAIIAPDEPKPLRTISTTVEELRWNGKQTSHLGRVFPAESNSANHGRRTSSRVGKQPNQKTRLQLVPLKVSAGISANDGQGNRKQVPTRSHVQPPSQLKQQDSTRGIPKQSGPTAVPANPLRK